MQPGPNLSPEWRVPFFVLWVGQALSLIGSRLVQFALVWWLTERAGTATAVTTLSLLMTLPQVLLGPIAGVLVDRLSRSWLMLGSDSISALASVIIAFLFWSDRLQFWHIYVAAFVGSIGGVMQYAAMSASTSLMVPKDQLQQIQGFNQALQGVLLLVTPILGALAIEFLPLGTIISIEAITAFFAIIPLLWIMVPQPARQSDGALTLASVWSDMVEGVRYIASWRGLLLITLLEIVLNFLGGATPSLLPLLVTKHFHADSFYLAWLRIALGGGLLIGGVALSFWKGFSTRMLVLPIGVIGMGVGMLLIGFSPSWAILMAIAGMALAGVSMSLINGTVMSMLQGAIAPEMQGRVFSVLQSTSMAAMPLGLLCAGFVADRWSPQLWINSTGSINLLIGIGIFFIPAILQFGSHVKVAPVV